MVEVKADTLGSHSAGEDHFHALLATRNFVKGADRRCVVVAMSPVASCSCCCPQMAKTSLAAQRGVAFVASLRTALRWRSVRSFLQTHQRPMQSWASPSLRRAVCASHPRHRTDGGLQTPVTARPQLSPETLRQLATAPHCPPPLAGSHVLLEASWTACHTHPRLGLGPLAVILRENQGLSKIHL
jgi:hypothetical protein